MCNFTSDHSYLGLLGYRVLNAKLTGDWTPLLTFNRHVIPPDREPEIVRFTSELSFRVYMYIVRMHKSRIIAFMANREQGDFGTQSSRMFDRTLKNIQNFSDWLRTEEVCNLMTLYIMLAQRGPRVFLQARGCVD